MRNDYSLKENKGFRSLMRKLFSSTTKPCPSRLWVKCFFYRPDGSVLERITPVRRPEYHFEPIVIDGTVVGRRLVVDGGYVALTTEEECYLVQGIPPFHFLSSTTAYPYLPK